jgi:hypothetical protein
MYKIGDEVWYSGAWGRGPLRSGILDDIELVDAGAKYGESANRVPKGLADDRWVGGVTLDDGETKWGYGHQFKKKSDEN